MITVTVILKGYLRNIFDNESCNFELENAATIIKLFEKLYEEYRNESSLFIRRPESKKIAGPVSVYISRENITDINYELINRDKVVLSRTHMTLNAWTRIAYINM